MLLIPVLDIWIGGYWGWRRKCGQWSGEAEGVPRKSCFFSKASTEANGEASQTDLC